MEQRGEGIAYPKEALGVGQRRQDGGCEQLVPVWRDDSHHHNQDSAGPVLNRLGQHGPQHDRRGKQ